MAAPGSRARHRARADRRRHIGRRRRRKLDLRLPRSGGRGQNEGPPHGGPSVPQDGDSLSTRSVARTRGLRSAVMGGTRHCATMQSCSRRHRSAWGSALEPGLRALPAHGWIDARQPNVSVLFPAIQFNVDCDVATVCVSFRPLEHLVDVFRAGKPGGVAPPHRAKRRLWIVELLPKHNLIGGLVFVPSDLGDVDVKFLHHGSSTGIEPPGPTRVASPFFGVELPAGHTRGLRNVRKSGPEGDRTPGLQSATLALSQLSYGPQERCQSSAACVSAITPSYDPGRSSCTARTSSSGANGLRSTGASTSATNCSP